MSGEQNRSDQTTTGSRKTADAGQRQRLYDPGIYETKTRIDQSDCRCDGKIYPLNSHPGIIPGFFMHKYSLYAADQKISLK
ncbi:hypothetical protein PK21_gp46 [Geobacillus phage vB_GthS_PK2.1]|nr:hypothetical protein PK21_gp46 [Geobacillus phage vB_GthS_PK2.1]